MKAFQHAFLGLCLVLALAAFSKAGVVIEMPSQISATRGQTVHIPVTMDFSGADPYSDFFPLSSFGPLQVSFDSGVFSLSSTFVGLTPGSLSNQTFKYSNPSWAIAQKDPSSGTFAVGDTTYGANAIYNDSANGYQLSGLGARAVLDLYLTVAPDAPYGSTTVTLDGANGDSGDYRGEFSLDTDPAIPLTPGSVQISVNAVPEPSSLILCGAAGVLLGLAALRKLGRRTSGQ